ncbi:MAG: DUF4252 domain-containing protein [Flavobacteriales bacterium]|jgi:histidyl-tRNA synthetase|nr:DUF4252 domain-containing protein [Flavobacteriales bacterium]
MKTKLLILSLFIGAFAFAQNNIFTKYFDDLSTSEGITKVNISGKLFGLLSHLEMEDQEDQEVVDMLKTITNFTMYTLDEDLKTNSLLNKVNKLSRKGYESLMTVEEKDETINFMIKEKNNKVSELVMVVNSDSNLVLMSISGLIDLDKLSKLSKVGISQTDKLKKLKKLDKKN